MAIGLTPRNKILKLGIKCLWYTLTILVVAGCDTGPAPSLYNPDAQSAPDPSITNIEPQGGALAGVDVVTITGTNFSEVIENNLVYFGTTRGEVLEATPTQLKTRSPNTPQENLDLKVSVLQAENFSNSVPYRLDAAAEEFGSIAGFEEVFSLTTDVTGNLYVSLFSDNRSVGLVKMTPEGERSTFVETTFKWDAITFGSDGFLYAARGVRALFRFQEGGAQETWAVIPDNSVSLVTIDFDTLGNLWAGGNNANIYRIAPDLSIQAFPFEADVKSIRFYEGHLYVAATQNEASKVWRFAVDANGNLGSAEEYFDLSSFANAESFSLAFAANGDLAIGTSHTDPLILVTPDRSGGVFYPGILQPPAIAVAWGAGTSLYMVQGRTSSSDSNIIRINSRREGSR